ncbi:hypothetical protein H4F02_003529 [Salmonella enterica]|nr:hypothetical protein [Salmonella enterica]EIJ6244629.1 hypothetical protein [Salmonella enterica]
MADLFQFVSGQAGHLHDAGEVEAILQHSAGYFQGGFTLAFEFAFITAFLFADLDTFKASFLDAFLFKLLCDGHECVSVLGLLCGG